MAPPSRSPDLTAAFECRGAFSILSLVQLLGFLSVARDKNSPALQSSASSLDLSEGNFGPVQILPRHGDNHVNSNSSLTWWVKCLKCSLGRRQSGGPTATRKSAERLPHAGIALLLLAGLRRRYGPGQYRLGVTLLPIARVHEDFRIELLIGRDLAAFH